MPLVSELVNFAFFMRCHVSSPSLGMGFWLRVHQHGFLPLGPRLAESPTKYRRARGMLLFTGKWLVVIVTGN